MDKSLLAQLKNYTILCVEDEEGIRKRLINTLRYYFKDVYEATDGKNGYEIYKEYKPDIVLSDIEMPLQNGIEMVKKIRKDDSSVIIIMATAYSNEEYLFDLINQNINHFIKKPINSDKLLDGIVKSFGDRLILNLYFNEDIYFDIRLREFFYRDEIVNLRKRDKEFLLLLHKNKNSVTTYEMIEEYIWVDKIMTQTALKTFIKEIRQRFPTNLIQNISQVGYKLVLT